MIDKERIIRLTLILAIIILISTILIYLTHSILNSKTTPKEFTEKQTGNSEVEQAQSTWCIPGQILSYENENLEILSATHYNGELVCKLSDNLYMYENQTIFTPEEIRR